MYFLSNKCSLVSRRHVLLKVVWYICVRNRLKLKLLFTQNLSSLIYACTFTNVEHLTRFDVYKSSQKRWCSILCHKHRICCWLWSETMMEKMHFQWKKDVNVALNLTLPHAQPRSVLTRSVVLPSDCLSGKTNALQISQIYTQGSQLWRSEFGDITIKYTASHQIFNM